MASVVVVSSADSARRGTACRGWSRGCGVCADRGIMRTVTPVRGGSRCGGKSPQRLVGARSSAGWGRPVAAASGESRQLDQARHGDAAQRGLSHRPDAVQHDRACPEATGGAGTPRRGSSKWHGSTERDARRPVAQSSTGMPRRDQDCRTDAAGEGQVQSNQARRSGRTCPAMSRIVIVLGQKHVPEQVVAQRAQGSPPGRCGVLRRCRPRSGGGGSTSPPPPGASPAWPACPGSPREAHRPPSACRPPPRARR